MILATGDKSPFGGKDVFVPGFLEKSVKDRNKVHDYLRRGRESEEVSTMAQLAIPAGFFALFGTIIAGMAHDNVVVVLACLLVMLVPCLSALGWVAITAIIGPKKPETPIICQDDIHWSMLLVAFGDNKDLWDRLTNVLKNGRGIWVSGLSWYKRSETPLMRELAAAVSAFMTIADPTVEDAQSVRANVVRIFDKHDQMELELKAAREAAKEVEAASDQRLFDAQVQMAHTDTSLHTITTNLLH